MNEYRSTVNLPECKLGKTVWLPDSARTAVLVGTGLLVPVVKALLEPLGDEPGVPAPSPLRGRLGARGGH